jgi:hypothetical protein
MCVSWFPLPAPQSHHHFQGINTLCLPGVYQSFRQKPGSRKEGASKKKNIKDSKQFCKETILLVSPAHRSNSEVTIQSFLSILTSFSNSPSY